MKYEEYTDGELIAALKELDQDEDYDVSEWEADFIQSMLDLASTLLLTDKQRAKMVELLEKYDEWRDDQ